MNVLLSIKPRFVEKIAERNKEYEFRKAIFKDVTKKVFIYSSSPVKKIIGYFLIDHILEDTPQVLWEKCANYSGIEQDEFFEYFKNKEKGYAIKIGKIFIYKNPLDPYENHSNFIPPQSFYYINESKYKIHE